MQATEIRSVIGREVLDSRGNPTVEAEVQLSGGIVCTAIAPSGALSKASISAPAAQLLSPLFIDHTPFVCSLRQSVPVNGSGVSLTVTPT